LKNRSQKYIISICFLTLLFFVVFLFYKNAHHKNEILGLKEFYGIQGINVYSQVLNASDIFNSEVNPYVEPQMGWKTGGNPVINPTKVASEGLVKVLRGDIVNAQKCASWLVDNSTEIDGALFFPFKFDFAPYWPYFLKAPWNSGLTQGLALGLFSFLYKETGQEEYKSFADKIFKSYEVPIEDGGFTRFEKKGPFFEEYPTEVPTRVLNGAAVAMLALHDYALITGNKNAMDMFKKSVNRLEELLPQYEVKDSGTGMITSSYSLAPVRPEILGRFVGGGNILVSEMKLIGLKGDSEEVISSVHVGDTSDDNVINDFYIWPDKKAMNWGDPVIIEGIHGREVNGRKGEYGHAPFKFSNKDICPPKTGLDNPKKLL